MVSFEVDIIPTQINLTKVAVREHVALIEPVVLTVNTHDKLLSLLASHVIYRVIGLSTSNRCITNKICMRYFLSMVSKLLGMWYRTWMFENI